MAEQPARDLNLECCVTPWKSVRYPAIKTPALAPIKEMYDSNLKRVYALTIFPPAIVNATRQMGDLAARVHFNYKEQIVAGSIDEQTIRLKVFEAVEADADERDLILRAGGDKARNYLDGEIAFGFRALNEFLKGELRAGAHAWLSAQITGVWTAFESMAEELWATAVNAHPRGLAELKGTRRGQGEDRKVDLKFLQIHDYDLSTKMGTVLKERYAFDKLEEVRRAYAEASFDDDADIKRVISDRALDALALTRHVIVHNSGIIDLDFLKRKADLPAAIVDELGKPLPLDGEVTAALVAPVINLGWNLIIAVDQWLFTHQT